MAQTRSSNNACQACQILFDGCWRRCEPKGRSQLTKYKKLVKSGQKIKLRHHNVPALGQSADDGCPMCVLVLRELQRWNSIEDLRQLQNSEHPGARVSIFGPKQDRDRGPPTKDTEVSARFSYKSGTSASKIWCFMEISWASTDQGISRVLYKKWRLIMLE